jgi:thioredoxin reductase (NADPH)
MGQPILLLVSDQGRVLEALAGDLSRRFGAEYRILGERSPAAALATLERLAARSEEVALVMAAQQMREMTGIDFIVRAHEPYPSAKRVLLVGRRKWTSANPAVRAMMLGQIDDYLFEPWLPVGRWLYLPITQVLPDWVPMRVGQPGGLIRGPSA